MFKTIADGTESAEIRALAQRYLDRHQALGFRVDVSAGPVELDGDEYCITVDFSRDNVYAYEYNPVLVETERDVWENEGRRILFIPALRKG